LDGRTPGIELRGMHAWRSFLLEKRHERGKACNDQNTFNFIRPQHACISFLSAVALGRKPLDLDFRRGTIVKRWKFAGPWKVRINSLDQNLRTHACMSILSLHLLGLHTARETERERHIHTEAVRSTDQPIINTISLFHHYLSIPKEAQSTTRTAHARH
jgi:hypothetical protein